MQRPEVGVFLGCSQHRVTGRRGQVVWGLVGHRENFFYYK